MLNEKPPKPPNPQKGRCYRGRVVVVFSVVVIVSTISSSISACVYPRVCLLDIISLSSSLKGPRHYAFPRSFFHTLVTDFEPLTAAIRGRERDRVNLINKRDFPADSRDPNRSYADQSMPIMIYIQFIALSRCKTVSVDGVFNRFASKLALILAGSYKKALKNCSPASLIVSRETRPTRPSG